MTPFDWFLLLFFAVAIAYCLGAFPWLYLVVLVAVVLVARFLGAIFISDQHPPKPKGGNQ